MSKLNSSPALRPFFSPEGVAIIGASHDPTKLGYGLARNLLRSGYQGKVHFVNIKGGTLFGQTVYRNVTEVPDPVDLATILIPAPYVPQALLDCAARGLHNVIIGSGGFREVGAQGKALEDQIVSIARKHNIRLIGPNCIGLLDTHIPINITFLPPPGPSSGDVAFLSQSGAICASVIDWARGQGFGISRLVSLGNQADLTETDLLETVASDPYTKVVTLYIEGIKDGRRFVDEAAKVSRQKPIIALKVGRFGSGQRAVASHTGALAGRESAYNAAFTRSGVLRAETSEEMFDWARALAWCPPARGNRVAVLTNAGGPGVTAADALEANGMVLAEFKPETHKALEDLLPPAASIYNPVDMLASATPTQFAESLRIVLEDSGVDSAMVIFPTPPMYTAGSVAKAILPVIQNSSKPVVVVVMGERLIQEAVEILRAEHIPEYRFPERAASALAALTKRKDALKFANEQLILHTDVSKEQALEVIHMSPAGLLDAKSCERLFAAYRLPTLSMELAHNAREATEIAQKMGLPVALKVASADIPHKSDVGGVLLNLGDLESVRQGFDTLMENVRKQYPTANINGVYIQRMVPPGQEVIVGGVNDPQFGPVVMFGSGGVEVEGLKDVAFALAPLSALELDHMLGETWAGQKLQGFRNISPADIKAVKDTITRIGQLMFDIPQIQEVEINPLRVFSPGKGAAALDIRVRINKSLFP